MRVRCMHEICTLLVENEESYCVSRNGRTDRANNILVGGVL